MVDLWVPGEALSRGRWRAAVTNGRGSRSAAAERLRRLASERKPLLTVQVKSRVEWADPGSYDALKYSSVLDSGSGLARSELIAPVADNESDPLSRIHWKRETPDLFAWVGFDDLGDRVNVKCRLGTADDVKLAIVARETWQSKKPAASRSNSWSGSKLAWQQVWGLNGWERHQDLNDADVAAIRRHGRWDQWAVGVDLSTLLSAVPRPELPPLW